MTTPIAPEINQSVLYTLSEGDAAVINKRRADFDRTRRTAGEALNTGYIGHIGNSASKDDVCAAVVVRTFSPNSTTANLKVLLDGNDDYWATSVPQGEGPGTWA